MKKSFILTVVFLFLLTVMNVECVFGETATDSQTNYGESGYHPVFGNYEIREDGFLINGEYVIYSENNSAKFAFELSDTLVMYGSSDLKFEFAPNTFRAGAPENVMLSKSGDCVTFSGPSFFGRLIVFYEGYVCDWGGKLLTLQEALLNSGFDVTKYVYPNGFSLGDFNYDNSIDSADSSAILNTYAYISTKQIKQSDLMSQEYAADVNGDGSVDAIDASLILSYYVYVQNDKSETGPMTLAEFINN